MARRIRRSGSGAWNWTLRARRAPVALLVPGLLLAAVGVALAGPAGSILSQDPVGPSGLAKAGPVNPANGFPDWYKDKEGVALEPCLDPKDPMCIMGTVADPDAPLKLESADPAQNNFPDEFFYFNGGSALDSVGVPDGRGLAGRASLVLALEGAFGGGAPRTGDQMAFSRFRVRVTGGLTPDAEYAIHYPYGTAHVKTDPGDPSLFVTEDIGITPGAFSDALSGRVGPFLRWTPDPADPLPPGYLGDPAVDHTVTGSPAGVDQNFFAIVGPNAGASAAAANRCTVDNIGATKLAALGNPDANDCVFTDLFTIMGKESVRGGVEVHSATYSRSADGATKVDVVAESKSGQNIQVEDPDPARRLTPARLFATTQADADNGDYLAHITIPGGGGPPDTVAVANYSDTPRTLKTPHVIDRVTGTATFDTDSDRLHVVAASSDKSSGPSAQLSLPYYNKQLEAVPGDPDAAQAADVAMTAPPATVTVKSSRDGRVELPVTVTGADSALAGLWADAGRDRTVTPGASVTLDGTNSSGNIDGYEWTGPYDVTANPDGTFTLSDRAGVTGVVSHNATQSVNAPDAEGAQDGYRLTLAGTSAAGAANRPADEMVVTARTPAPVAEALAVTGARYRGDQQRWVVDGTSSAIAGNEVTVYNGPVAGGDVIGKAVVDRLGVWAVDVRDSALVPVPCADPADGDCVSVRSSNGTVVEGFVVDVTKPPPAPAAAPAVAALAAVPFAGAVAPAAARLAAFAAPRVAVAAGVTPQIAATTGIAVSVTVPAGATVLRLRLLTARGRLLVQSFRTVKGGTRVRLRLKAKQLRRQQRYVLQTAAGKSRRQLGRTTTVRFRVR